MENNRSEEDVKKENNEEDTRSTGASVNPEDSKPETADETVSSGETLNDEKKETCDNNEKPEKTERNEKKKVKKLEAKIAQLEKELAANKEAAEQKDKQYMLLYAEYDNFRRRSQKEKDGIYSDAYASALNSLLPVFDNLYRAVDADDEKSLGEGLRLTVKSYEEALAKMGVKEIDALGKTFNPELHCAVLHVDDDSYGENEVIEVLGKGYEKDGKVIRYSIVKVAN